MIVGLAACAPPEAAGDFAQEVRVAYRPGDPLANLGPDARVDRGLRAAAEELAASATRPDARLTPSATRLALARAGYPGDARFVRVVSPGTALPAALLDGLPRGGPLDLGWAWRDQPDGTRLWVLGWARRPLAMDPIRRDLPLDGATSLRVDGAAEPRLLLGRPDGTVDELSIRDGQARWIDRFPFPGEYRVEVLDGDRVALLFSLFVDGPPPPPSPLPGPAERPVAAEAEAAIFGWLAALRARAGLAPVARFGAFEPHARAHAACLVQAGVVAHATSRCPGVPALAQRTHHPPAKHHEDVAVADTAAEAWERLLDSPGHRLNLLCEPCTHASVGVIVEPPRVFAVVELLEMPQGEPRPIPAR
ncbi:MAG: hypothetical protein ACOZNI_37105 [Myxococcota bacterium]